MAKVAVIKTTPETVVEDYGKLMREAGYSRHISRDRKTILKLNLSWSLYFPACSTEPWQLDGVLKTLKEDKYADIHAVENKTVVTNPLKGALQNKWIPVLKKHSLEFEPLTEKKWINYEPKHEMLEILNIFPDGLSIPEMFVGSNIIHLPTVKTHGHTKMTGSMKNAFGGLITEKRHHCHKKIHEVLVDLLQIQKEIHPGMFTVMDGTVCGNGAGPRTMIPVEKDYILASSDSVAIDAVSAKMMGFDPLKIPFIKTAHDRGLGIGDFNQIDMVGEDISNVNFHFTTKKSPVVFFDQVLRTKYPIIEPLLFHTNLFMLCILGSEVYHDKVWYPLVGKKIIKKFAGSKWGKKFKEY